MRSIERTLLAWILAALALGAVLVALVTYRVTRDEIDEVFDANLKVVAESVASPRRSLPPAVDASRAQPPARTDAPDDTEIVTLMWTRSGERVYASDPRVKLRFTATEGLARPEVEGEPWIVYTSVDEQGVTQAAQRLSARQEMAGESAAKILPPLFGLTFVVGALLLYGLRRGLRPLDAAARDIASRSVRSLDAIKLELGPQEVRPLVASINDLMDRLAQAFATQRRFLADAAHELRTPITALRLQLRLLQIADNEQERTEALAELAAGIDRSQRLVEQLLRVARAEPDGEALRSEPVDLADLVRRAVAAFSARADHAGLDLGAETRGAIIVRGDVDQIEVLLNNLIENAVRYTPPPGVIDVAASMEGTRPVLKVTDTGPGIPEAERGRVFDRFYRCEGVPDRSRDGGGSGLGLAIVKAIAERHGAVVELGVPVAGVGLEVRVTFAPA